MIRPMTPHPLLPVDWRPAPAALLPGDPTTFAGPSLAVWIAVALLVLVTARSLIHVFAPDGGAGRIATVDLEVEGGRNIVAMFGQWGAIQLLLAMLLWTLLLRYPGLTPLVLGVMLIEPVLRSMSGRLKPLQTLGVAPGRRFNWLFAAAAGVGLYLALCPAT
jgi:hypothetical protein